MKPTIFCLIITIFLSYVCYAQQAYNVRTPYDPATQRLEENQRGEVLTFTLSDSKIYPGTEREISVYIPQQYDATKAACLLVCMDGILYDATTVMDNLIASGEMPITVGVFVNPGVVYNDKHTIIRYNRCKEFDSTDDTFASFLEKEVLPRVTTLQTQSGKPIILSNDPNDCCITGASSGGIAAFSVAWHRPDLFSRVYTTVGTFVAMRGGNNYPAIVRKTEPKPLRIYMQDGWYDTWNPIFGEWFEYNLLMESAFNFAGYEVFHKWDRGNHSIKYGTLAFPDAMRWLWRGYPTKVEKGISNNGMLLEILADGEDWQEITPAHSPTDIFACQDSMIAYAIDNTIYHLTPSGVSTLAGKLKTGEKLLGDNLTLRSNNLYHNGQKVAENLYGTQAAHALYGDQYIVLCADNTPANKNTWIITAGCRALAISPDYNYCVTGEANTHHLISTIISPTGEMLYSEPFYYLHDMSNGTTMPSGSMAFDTNGNLYVATAMGIQIADHNGRVRAILSLPAGMVNSLAFSGNYLYALCGKRLFVRKINAEGFAPIKGRIQYPSQGQG